jgi:S-(hydroxymethyl)glutathione dehydrogenase/alcohol dehydrogenase
MGIGGIGAFALQGAAHAGATNIIAVDPVEFKREAAASFGATHAASTMEEATAIAQNLTEGQGAQSAIICVGQMKPDYVREAFYAIAKDGIVVVTALGDASEVGIPIPLWELSMFQKRLQGSLFGGVAPLWDSKKMLDMYTAGQLKLDEAITSTYKLDDVARGYADMRDGKNIRGVIVY